MTKKTTPRTRWKRVRRRVARTVLSYCSNDFRATLLDLLISHPFKAKTPHGVIRFNNHGAGCRLRAKTILTKEPDSMAWIDRMAEGSVYYDIGANIGILALYAAKRGGVRVQAFEPAAVNYFNLLCNIELNGMEDLVSAHMVGLGDRRAFEELHVSQITPARSFSFKGKRNKPAAGRQVLEVIPLDTIVAERDLPPPNYIKIDVPGLTQEILHGAKGTLAHPELREIQIEVREDSKKGRVLRAFLADFGFHIEHRNMKKDGVTPADLIFARRSEDAPLP